jgi:hypothetical protein
LVALPGHLTARELIALGDLLDNNISIRYIMP